MPEFDACGRSCEVPVGLGVSGISILLPGGDFIDQGLFVGDAAIEALGRQDAELGFRQIEPAAMLRGVVPFKAFDQPSPASETSAFNNIRAFSSRRALALPDHRLKLLAFLVAQPNNVRLYRKISFLAMIASFAIVAMEANQKILSNWLKRPTSPVTGRLQVLHSTCSSSSPGRSRASRLS